jgi:enoyl-CoA hydratase
VIGIAVDDGVAVVTLDDPGRRNALSAPMVAGIIEAFDGFESDESVGAVVITGAPPAFCAGADLGDLSTAGADDLKRIYEGFLRVARCSLPTVAAVNGAAVGAGMNLALACDVRIAAPSAKFDTRFLQLGIHPGGGHTWLLRNAVGPQTAAAMVLFGQVLDGAAAERAGLVWACVHDPVEAAVEVARKAAAAPRGLAIAAKRTLREMAGVVEHAEAVDRELETQVWSIQQGWLSPPKR